MRRFIEGGDFYPIDGWRGGAQMHFNAYTPDRVVDLLQSSRTEFLNNAAATGPRLTNQLLTEEIGRFRLLNIAYSNMDGNNQNELEDLEGRLNNIARLPELRTQLTEIEAQIVIQNRNLEEARAAGTQTAQIRATLSRLGTQRGPLSVQIREAEEAQRNPDAIREQIQVLRNKIAFGNPFFLPSEDAEHPENFRTTPAFWQYLLVKYGYFETGATGSTGAP
jgi:hypothetical protein